MMIDLMPMSGGLQTSPTVFGRYSIKDFKTKMKLLAEKRASVDAEVKMPKSSGRSFSGTPRFSRGR